MATNSTSCYKSGATKPQQNVSSSVAALEPGAAQDRHRSTAQLSGRKGRNPGTCAREAYVRKSGRPVEQPGREQPSTDTRTRASRRMRGFRDPKRTQKFLSCFRPIRQHFALKRHVMRASLYRKQLAARFVAWRELAELALNPSAVF